MFPKRISVLVLAALALALVAGCGGPKKVSPEQAPSAGPAKPETRTVVRLEPARVEEMVETVEITGSLAALDDLTLSPKIAGRLSRVLVREGDTVRAGQLVATQETDELLTQLRQAEAGLASARSALAQAEAGARSSPVVTAATIRAAEAALAQARAALKKLEEGARRQEIEQAQKAVDAAKAAWDLAVADHARIADLYAKDAVSKQQLDAAKTGMDTARAQYESAQATLSLVKEGAREEDIEAARQAVRQAEQQLVQAKELRTTDVVRQEQVAAARAAVAQARAQVQLANQQLENTRIYCPVSGQVEARLGHPGQMAMPGQAILRVVSLGSVYFEGNVSETQLANVGVGQPVSVRLDAYPGRTLGGRVAAIRPVGDDQARLFTVRVALERGGLVLKPGMFARGEIAVRRVPSAVVVPKDAVVSRGGEPVVFVVKGGTAQKRPVTLGLSNAHLVQVTGVVPGEQVVVKGADMLVDGGKVQLEKRQLTETEERGRSAATGR